MSPTANFGALALSLGYVLAFSSVVILPDWIVAVSDGFGLTAWQAGAMVTAELGTSAIASVFCASIRPHPIPRKRIVVCTAIAMVANLSSLGATEIAIFGITRFAAACSYGVMLSDITRLCAMRADSHRIFVLQQFLLALAGAVYFALAAAFTPVAVRANSPLIFTAGINALMSLSLLGASLNRDFTGSTSLAVGLRNAKQEVIAIFFVLACVFCTHNALWGYLKIAADDLGITSQKFNLILSFATVFNLIGMFVMSKTSASSARALGVRLLLIVTIVRIGVATSDPLIFTVSVILLPFSLSCLTPYLLNLLSQLDASGKSAAAAPAPILIGSAVGPFCGGMATGVAGFMAVSVMSIVAAAASLILLFFSQRVVARRDQRHR